MSEIDNHPLPPYGREGEVLPPDWEAAVRAGRLTREMAEALATPDELMLRMLDIARRSARAPKCSQGH